MNKLTLTFPYYENPGMLRHQIAVWNSYPIEYRDRFEVIVVDDGSQEFPAIRNLPPVAVKFRLYRIKVDIAWNQTSARNLGVYEADKDSWMFLTDIDHVLDSQSFIAMINLDELHKQFYYTLSRLNGPEKGPYKSHPNSFVMHRNLYLEVGGYDEEFAGKVYATDGMFRKALKDKAEGTQKLDIPIIRFGREHISDASTRTLKRGRDFQTPEIMAKVKERDKQKRAKGMPPVVLSFPWERLL